jgi:arabinose-5-phosphate isomerase
VSVSAVSPTSQSRRIGVDPASVSADPAPPPTGAGLPEDERAFAQRVLEAEARGVSGLAGRLGPAFDEAVALIVRCADAHGTVLVTGLGKSGLIGAKIAATFTSLGIAAHYVHPTEAAHGDLGNFRKQDVCLALSYSGETEEVVALAGLLAQDGIPVISITRGDGPPRSSGLEKCATVSLGIGAVDEPDLSPAPTCSTTATLALGDVLALCASRRRNFTDDDFAKRHPGGTLGGLLRPVMEIVRFRVGVHLNAVPHDRTVAQALEQADTGVRRPGALLLVDPGTGVLTGIFTDADLRRLVRKNPADLARPVSDFMTRQASTLGVGALVRDAVRLVREKRADEIPVVEDSGRPVGILDVQDLVAMKVIKE